MIDWYDVARQAVWIVGAAVVVACVSFYLWNTGEGGRTRADAEIGRPLSLWLLAGLGLALFGSALAHGEPLGRWLLRLAVWIVVTTLAWRRWWTPGRNA